MVWIHSTFGLLLLIVLPTLLLGASELWNLWRPRGAHEPAARRERAEPNDGIERPGGGGRRKRRFPDEVVA